MDGLEIVEGLPIDAPSMRDVMGHFATGVTLITAVSSGAPVGIAANSFTSLSLDPPLVLLCVAKSSSTWPLLRAEGVFAVNMLAESAEAVCRRFATPGADRFGGLGWGTAVTGSPIVSEALAYVDCEIAAEHDGGDHTIVVGRVVALGVMNDGGPLLFYRGGYGKFES